MARKTKGVAETGNGEMPSSLGVGDTTAEAPTESRANEPTAPGQGSRPGQVSFSFGKLGVGQTVTKAPLGAE